MSNENTQNSRFNNIMRSIRRSRWGSGFIKREVDHVNFLLDQMTTLINRLRNTITEIELNRRGEATNNVATNMDNNFREGMHIGFSFDAPSILAETQPPIKVFLEECREITRLCLIYCSNMEDGRSTEGNTYDLTWDRLPRAIKELKYLNEVFSGNPPPYEDVVHER